MSLLDDYWQALERLKKNIPVHIPAGSPINNDTVALEAGRKRGSIKKSRKNFTDLIRAIDESESYRKPKSSSTDLIKLERAKKENYRELYHQALNRELMLIERLAELEKDIARFNNVFPINKQK